MKRALSIVMPLVFPINKTNDYANTRSEAN